VSLSLISYFICLEASNQSDLMQHNVPAAIFSHGTIFCVRRLVSAVRAVGAVCAACFPRLRNTERVVAQHKNMRYARQHRVCSARLPRFGEMFQWGKSLVCCYGALICICGAMRRQFHVRRGQLYVRLGQFYTCCRLFLLAPHAPSSFVLVPQ
jgi:hypothetical protein